jgi:hypothetical protein
MPQTLSVRATSDLHWRGLYLKWVTRRQRSRGIPFRDKFGYDNKD